MSRRASSWTVSGAAGVLSRREAGEMYVDAETQGAIYASGGRVSFEAVSIPAR